MAETTTSSSSSISTQILTTLGAGSGIDVVALAKNLTDVTKVPQQEAIQEKITASEASVSGYALIAYQLGVVKTAFEQLNDADELSVSSGTTSDINKVSFSALSGNAAAGSYDLTVSQLAQGQRTISDQFSSKTTVLNASPFDISLSVGATRAGTYTEALSQADLWTAIASGPITITDGSGNTITVTQAEINAAGNTATGAETLAGYAAALQAKAAASGPFAFNVAGNGNSGVTYTQKSAGTGVIASAQGPITAGISATAAISGVAAKYNVSATAAATTTLVVGDGKNTVSIASATYTSIAGQVAAIQNGAGYDDLLFTVASNVNGDGFEFVYKTTGAVTTAPTVTGSGGTHTVTSTQTGVTAVNAPTTTTIAVTDPTPAGVVSAINAAGTGVTARLVDTGIQGSNYRIMITGATGSQSVFSLSSSPDIGFGDVGNTLQTAQDAILSVNGLSITRSSNEISDAIGGATLALTATTDTAVRLNVSSDKSVMKTNVQAAVAAYNEFNKLLTDLTSSVPNEDLEYSGALAREQSAVRYIKQQVFDKIMGDSSTKSGVVSAMRDIGVSVDKTGSLTFNSDRFDAAALDHYEDVVAMLSANTSNQNLYSAASKGLAQDVATVITNLTNSTGIVATRKNNAEDYREDFADELLALEARMENVYQRYLTQFAAMDSMLEKIDGTKEYLTGQLESLANMYKPQ